MNQVTTVRNGLRSIVSNLERERDNLAALRDGISLPPAESAPEDCDAEPDPLSEMKAVIECGLHDCLEPLIRDLLAAAD
jgi:hypothetical protein